jgi:hypothetical protein
LDAENINTGLKKRESSITAYAVKAWPVRLTHATNDTGHYGNVTGLPADHVWQDDLGQRQDAQRVEFQHLPVYFKRRVHPECPLGATSVVD